jgi:trehalose synthase
LKKPCSATDPLWYKDAVIYEIHVRAFADSNADGIGDFQGLISKLDYLQELGVTCLWLLPFFPSPLRDDGYDIADYTSVNPQYGTLDDFQQFLDQAHARNIQVMIELVINHTSDQHPWFQRARLAPKDSPDRNMYVWSDTDKLYDGVRIIFTDTEKSNWTWDDTAHQYYWHRFFSHQPDLNFDNPRVMEEVLNAMRFWMDMGVDGLRLDAIPYLIERDGTSCENVPETHVLIKHIRSVMDAEYENRLILAEANMWPADVRPYFGDGDECQMAFHFPLMPRIYMALRQEDRLPITDIMAQTPAIPDNCQWGLFLRNHDELTLEMVTDDERDYMNLAYAADARMRINVGIRRRLAPLVDNNRRRIELLNSLLLSFPGTPIIYYGDEIGMGDNIYLGDRNGVRTPMQWNADRNAGFSKAVPAKLYFPVIMDPVWGYQAINVEAQESDPSSLLHWTRNMIALRKLFQVFGRGTLEFLHPENRKILAYIRDCSFPDGHAETILCVANLSRFAQPVSLDLAKFVGRNPVEMLGYVAFPEVTAQPYPLTLAPYSFLWLELQPEEAIGGEGKWVGLGGDFWEGDVAEHLYGITAHKFCQIEGDGLGEAGEIGDAEDGFGVAVWERAVADVGEDFAIFGVEEFEGAAAEDLEELAQGDHVARPVEERGWVGLLGFDVDGLVAPDGVHDDREVELGWDGFGEAGVAVGVPLHRGADAVAVAEVDVVAHADLVAVVDDGRPGEAKEQRVEEFDAAAIVVDQGSQAATDAYVDSHAGVGGVGEVHVIALVVSDHLEGELVMVAEEEAPLAVIGDGRGLGHDVGDGEAVLLPECHVDARHEGEMESHLALVAVAEVGAYVGGPHVGFGEDKTVLVLGIHDGANVLDEDVGFGDVFAGGPVAFDQVGNGVEAQAIDSHVHPEAHGVEYLFHDAGVIEVEIGLMGEEAMPVVLVSGVVPGPVRFFGVGKDDADAVVELVGIGPDVHVAVGGIFGSEAGALKPRVLIGGVVDDELNHDLDVAGMGLVEELLEVVEGAVLGVDRGVVGDVVAVVAEGRRKEREKPEAGDAEFLEVVELGDEALEVADAVGVGVGKGADVDLVDDRVFVPERVGGAAGLLQIVRLRECCKSS